MQAILKKHIRESLALFSPIDFFLPNFRHSLESSSKKLGRVPSRIIVFSCLYILFFPKTVFAGPTPTDTFQISVSVQPFKNQEKEKYHLKAIQPYRFDKTTLIKSISSLAYQKRGISWSNKRRVFNAALTSQLAPIILKNFSLVNPDQRITFRIKNATGKTILEGDTFLTNEGLHWRMTKIQKIQRAVDDFSVSGDPWRLVPLTHQTYKTKEEFKNVVQNITNWVVFNQIRPRSDRIMELPSFSEEQQLPSTPKRPDIKNRLKVLEELKREGLIDEEEYNINRQKILDDL